MSSVWKSWFLYKVFACLVSVLITSMVFCARFDTDGTDLLMLSAVLLIVRLSRHILYHLRAAPWYHLISLQLCSSLVSKTYESSVLRTTLSLYHIIHNTFAEVMRTERHRARN
ncbi:hypothetical protein DAEQUDRAFT_312951 [Daedalea quercina L-15889]|uniref:Uncharacterized protein n=1 Tax=Daedalea quercina L-15889 TaxID=1314783 RepID=A0A165Q0G5_9APHY|nr:hypothetical protein DAEQUDRAFT_312951 [Daedalea quercina L-15889]